MQRTPVDGLIHSCLGVSPNVVREDPARSGAGGFERLNDRERVALLLQGAGLLAALERAGWRLEEGFSRARVEEGRLLVHGAGPGVDDAMAQAHLVALAARAFGLPPGQSVRQGLRLPGRGEARRIARELSAAWSQTVTALEPALVVDDLLARGGFLFEQRYGSAREALACELTIGGARRRWLVGPAGARERFLAAASDYPSLVVLLASPRARELWQDGSGPTLPPSLSRDPGALAARGRWRLAVEALERDPPTDASGRRLLAECLFADGRFERALELLRGRRGRKERLLRAQCQCQLGELRAARRTVAGLEALALDDAETVELGAVALRVHANSGDPERTRHWLERLSRVGRCGDPSLASRALVEAAFGHWDVGELDEARRCLDEAAARLPEEELDDHYSQARALLARASGDSVEAVHWVERAIGGARRRRLRRFEAGRLWNDLLFVRTATGDLAGAERAGHHAYAQLSRCDGRTAVTLALANVAEVRLRRGRLAGVREIIERTRQENRLTGNVRGGSQDDGLWARYWLAHGEPERALEVCRAVLGTASSEGSVWQEGELSILAARALGWLGRSAEAAAMLAAMPESALGDLEPEERPAVLALAGQAERARCAAAALSWAELRTLWLTVLDGRAVAASPEPGALAAAVANLPKMLEPYRRGRLILDLHLLGVDVGAELRAAGAGALAAAGAIALAERLEPTAASVLDAVEQLLDAAPEETEAIARLLRRVGHPSVRLVWRGAGEERLLIDGAGGSTLASCPAGVGTLVLESAVDAAWQPLLRLVALRCFAVQPDSASQPARLADAARQRPRGAGARSGARHGIVGSSAVLRAALDRLERWAAQEVPVLIQGETGTGKELAARLLHGESARSRGPFEAHNCAALAQENLLLSQLFGHVRGAYTGAERDKQGLFEVARGGTVLLDEIGDLPAAAQGMLLRVLEEREVRRLGETRVRSIDVRLLAATHRPLEELVERGVFREDLFYRLAVATVTLPPLREREGDVEELAEFFAARLPGSPRLVPETVRLLAGHRWPGNVRQLRHAIETAAVLASTDPAGGDPPLIEPRHLESLADAPQSPRGTYHERVEAFRRSLIEEALARHTGNRAAAARELGITRQALSQAVRRLGLRDE